ncbi:hypothetical protein HMPREF0972_01214 [Actinomyces sp. oral taxon 848 str. F0332]|nr:hypothetical protein HMPREF0972_01214 [Actinomyces sp. oral taxon 848 str. F0332]
MAFFSSAPKSAFSSPLLVCAAMIGDVLAAFFLICRGEAG